MITNSVLPVVGIIPRKGSPPLAKNVPHRLHRFAWDPSWEGVKLRKLLQTLIPELGSKGAFAAITAGLARIDGVEAPLAADAQIPANSLLLVDLRHGIHGEGEARHPGLLERMRVVHDDRDVVVVAKKSGVLVQPLEDEEEAEEQGTPLVELMKHYWKSRGLPIVNPHLVQRLDRDTSGLLVLAKTVDAARKLQEQLKPPRQLKREYLALVAGVFKSDSGTWKTYLGWGPTGLRQSMADATPEAAEEKDLLFAETHYKVVERLRNATLLELELETGRTHQIRIHCAESGHPVLGEEIYERLGESMLNRIGKGKFSARSPWNPAKEAERLIADGQTKLVAPAKPPKRLALHATRLTFNHPTTGERMLFEDPLPTELKQYLGGLRIRE